MSDVISIELGKEVEPTVCECCGGVIQHAYGFVYKGGDAYSIYHASWSPAHAARGANVALQFGDWSENATAGARYRVGIEIRLAGDQYQMEFLEPEDSAWLNSSNTPMLTRAKALTHPKGQEFLHVAEHVLFDDHRVKRGVDGPTV